MTFCDNGMILILIAHRLVMMMMMIGLMLTKVACPTFLFH